MSSRLSSDFVLFGVASVVLALDQISKHLVRLHLTHGIPWNPARWLRPVLSLTYVTNKGAAFGLFPQLDWLYAVITVVVIALILFFYRRLPFNHWLVRVSLGMQLGGAVGNLADRLWHDWRVTDFIDLNFWPLQEWPVFNVADSSIVIGVCILVVVLLLEEDQLLPSPDTPSGGEECTD